MVGLQFLDRLKLRFKVWRNSRTHEFITTSGAWAVVNTAVEDFYNVNSTQELSNIYNYTLAKLSDIEDDIKDRSFVEEYIISDTFSNFRQRLTSCYEHQRTLLAKTIL